MNDKSNITNNMNDNAINQYNEELICFCLNPSEELFNKICQEADLEIKPLWITACVDAYYYTTDIPPQYTDNVVDKLAEFFATGHFAPVRKYYSLMMKSTDQNLVENWRWLSALYNKRITELKKENKTRHMSLLLYGFDE